MFEVTVANSETGAVYFLQMFSKLDIGQFAKALNDAYWAETKIGPEEKEDE